MDEIRQRILSLLSEKKISKAELQRIANLKKSTLYNVFNEKTDINNVSIGTMKSIARSLNTTLDYLIEGKNSVTKLVLGRDDTEKETHKITTEQLQTIQSIIETIKDNPEEDNF